MTQQRIIVVGGGVVGLATACALAAQADVAVTVLERFTVGHEWSSSHGLSRAIRHEYGPDAIYTLMVARSLVLWAALAGETGRHLYTETGVLTLGQPDDGHTLPGFEVMRAEGLPVEQLTPVECARRFPAFAPEGFNAITYNPKGGMLHASECLRALTERLLARGGDVREGVMVRRVEPRGMGGRVILADGTPLDADRVVVTAGPWVHDVLPELPLPVRATRQQVCYLGGLSPTQFGVGRFPVFLANMAYYGFPLIGAGWFKVAAHIFGPTVDPNVPYAPDAAEIERVRDFLRHTIPAAADAELVATDCCMYDLSPDEHLILDAHPGGAGVIIGSGFSGHGFKFGIVVGELLAALALGQTPLFPLEQFRLSRFG
jgi:monomeric sarcosine oxidase